MTPPIYRYCPQCAAELETRIIFGKPRPVCPRCGFIHFADPKVAAGVLVEQDDQVLLVRRINEPLQGLWSIPAGFVDAHEDPQQAALRECREETGLEVKITGLVDVINGREHERGADIIIVYRAEVIGGSLLAGDDADQAAFFPRSQLPPLAFRATRRVLGVE
ncbi:MAG: NUDIX hydrolase [Bellilinea sp.]|nr:NUDIX hydrolase [Bellilinea sp.]